MHKTITNNVEHYLILRGGGFELKPWVFSRQSEEKKDDHETRKSKSEPMILPNQIKQNENKALGLGYGVEKDELHIMTTKRKRRSDLARIFCSTRLEHQLLTH